MQYNCNKAFHSLSVSHLLNPQESPCKANVRAPFFPGGVSFQPCRAKFVKLQPPPVRWHRFFFGEIGGQILATVKENQGIDQIDGLEGKHIKLTNIPIPVKIAFCVFVRLLSKPLGLWVWKSGKNKLLRVQDDEDSHSQRNVSRNYSKIVSAFGNLQGELKWWDAHDPHDESEP